MISDNLRKKQHRIGMVTIALLGLYLCTMWIYVLPFLLIGITAYLIAEFIIWLEDAE